MRKILIIEDNKSVRENLIDLLEINNFKVFSASNGNEGINLAAKINPDLILCDIMMPGIDGYDVKSKLLEDEHNLLIPFVYLTAKSDISDIRKGMILGADDYITKPFDNRELIASINARLNKSEKIVGMMNSTRLKGKKEIKNIKDRILVTINNKPELLVISDIIAIKADANYTWIYTVNNNKFIVRKLLKEWQKLLPVTDFLRVHQSYIINLNYIKKIEKLSNRSYIIRMQNIKNFLPVSQRYTSIIKSKFSI